jgi:hypothetical protein
MSGQLNAKIVRRVMRGTMHYSSCKNQRANLFTLLVGGHLNVFHPLLCRSDLVFSSP